MSGKQKVLSFEDIKAVDDLSAEAVEVPEWGGVLMIRPLTASEVERINNDAKGNGFAMNRAALALTCVDPALTPAQVDYLWTKSQKAVVQVITELARINGWSKEAGEAAKASFPAGPDEAAQV